MSWSNNLYLRWAATAGVVLLMAMIGWRWLGHERPSADAALLLESAPVADAAEEDVAAMEASPAAEASAAPDEPALAVDVIGAVATPGVYRLDAGARVDDAVAAAGGFAPDANRELINLAAALEDGEQIRVPHVGDSAQATAGAVPEAGAPAQAASGLVDINSADAVTLEQLPGIGPATAQAIVTYREANGPFGAVEDLQNVKGIGPALYGKLAGLVTAGG